MNSYRPINWLPVTLLFSVLVSLYFGYLWLATDGDLSVVRYPDERNYYITGAQKFLELGWGYFLTEKSIWNGPLNIIWLALFGLNLSIVKFANILLVAFAGIALWDTLKRLVSLKAAYIGLVAYIFHPALCHFSGTLLSEPPFVAFLVLSTWAYTRGSEGKLVWIFAAGVFLGFATLARPTTQLFPFFFLLWELGRILFLRRPLSASKYGLTFFLGAVLILGPYLVKNYYFFGKLGIANGSGAVLYLGNDLRTDGHEPIYSQLDFDTIETTFPHAHLDIEGDRRLTKAAIENIKRNPIEILELTARKIFRYMWGSPEAYFYPFNSIRAFIAHRSGMVLVENISQIIWVSLCSAGLIMGLIYGLPMLGATSSFFVSILTYFLALHSLLFPIARLALPFHVLSIPLAVAGFLVKPVYSLMGATVLFLGVCFLNQGELSHQVNPQYSSYFSNRVELDRANIVYKSNLKEIDGNSFRIVGDNAHISFFIPKTKLKKNQVLVLALRSDKSLKAKTATLDALVGTLEGGLSKAVAAQVVIRLSTGLTFYRLPVKVPKDWSDKTLLVKLSFPSRTRKANLTLESLVFAN